MRDQEIYNIQIFTWWKGFFSNNATTDGLTYEQGGQDFEQKFEQIHLFFQYFEDACDVPECTENSKSACEE